MPKYKVKNEQVLSEFLGKFWKGVGQRKGQKFVQDLFKNDPKIVKLMKQAEKIADEIHDRIDSEDASTARELEKKYGKDIFK
jgi:hypothetical protein|tara:strand:- start:993 stop:1238 length:246 start_codon:yes stop_codon:yes gene_type:complete